LFRFFNRKDVRLPVQLQRAMAAEAEATREAKAKVRPTTVAHNGPPSFTSIHRSSLSFPVSTKSYCYNSSTTVILYSNAYAIDRHLSRAGPLGPDHVHSSVQGLLHLVQCCKCTCNGQRFFRAYFIDSYASISFNFSLF